MLLPSIEVLILHRESDMASAFRPVLGCILWAFACSHGSLGVKQKEHPMTAAKEEMPIFRFGIEREAEDFRVKTLGIGDVGNVES